jgi:hypothetical protein
MGKRRERREGDKDSKEKEGERNERKKEKEKKIRDRIKLTWKEKLYVVCELFQRNRSQSISIFNKI